MAGRRVAGIALATAAMVLAACGGITDSLDFDEEAFTDTNSGAGAGPGTDSGSAKDTGVVITVDSAEYMVDTELGGACDTQGDPDRGSELTAFGYDVDSGRRVELSFSTQSAETSISGEEEYFGGLSVATDDGGSWQVRSLERWAWLSEDRSTVTGSVTMEDSDGQTAEITFDVTCP